MASFCVEVYYTYLHKPNLTVTEDKSFTACLFPGPGGDWSSGLVLLDRHHQGVQPVFWLFLQPKQRQHRLPPLQLPWWEPVHDNGGPTRGPLGLWLTPSVLPGYAVTAGHFSAPNVIDIAAGAPQHSGSGKVRTPTLVCVCSFVNYNWSDFSFPSAGLHLQNWWIVSGEELPSLRENGTSSTLPRIPSWLLRHQYHFEIVREKNQDQHTTNSFLNPHFPPDHVVYPHNASQTRYSNCCVIRAAPFLSLWQFKAITQKLVVFLFCFYCQIL